MPQDIDTIVCAGGIGRGMFNGLRRRGTRVFITDAITVGRALAELGAGNLEELNEVASCGGGHHDHKAAHTHDHDHSCGCGSQHEEGGSCCGHH
jgi:predicted Fe-Mo cluster-binding NifX family protein